MVETKGASGSGRHLFLPPLGDPSGATLLVGFHWFGTSDRVEWPEPVVVQLICHALIQRLPAMCLTDVADSLACLYDFYCQPPSETGPAVAQAQSLAMGISTLVQKRIDALAEGPYTDERLSNLKQVRNRLANTLDYADQKIAHFSDRLELADLFLPDSEPVFSSAKVESRRVPDDGPLACDPDET